MIGYHRGPPHNDHSSNLCLLYKLIMTYLSKEFLRCLPHAEQFNCEVYCHLFLLFSFLNDGT